MVPIEEAEIKPAVAIANPFTTRDGIVRFGRAQLRVFTAGKSLVASGVNLATVASLASATAEQFELLFQNISLKQAELLRAYLSESLELAEAAGGGEVVLCTIESEVPKIAANDTGLVSLIHDLSDVAISVKKLEANATAKSLKNNPNLAESLRKFKEQVEHGAGEVASQFVA